MKKILVLVCFLLLLTSCGKIANPQAEAVTVAKEYFDVVNGANYPKAYDLLDFDSQRQVGESAPEKIKGLENSLYLTNLMKKSTLYTHITLIAQKGNTATFNVCETNYIWEKVWGLGANDINYDVEFTVENGLVMLIKFADCPALNDAIDKNATGLIGIGVEATDDKYLKIIVVHDGYPAKDAGLQVDDVITAIDGINLHDMNITAFEDVYRLRGNPDVPIKLTILRGEQEMQFEIPRVKGDPYTP